MALNFELKIEQAQKVVMTLELQQAINLLQYSTLELSNYIQEEVIQNPLLEIREKELENEDEGEDAAEKTDSGEDDSLDWEEYFQDLDYPYRREKPLYDRDVEYPTLESYASEEVGLQEHLEFQLKMSPVKGRSFLIAEYLVGNINPSGYLQGAVAEHARFLGVAEEEVLEMLSLVQGFDPPGIGARTLEECLLLQLPERENVPSTVEPLIKGYLAEIAEGKYREIAGKLGISMKKLQDALDFIRTLDPKPGSHFGGAADVRYVYPDIVVQKVEGEYVIIINDNVPQLYINPYYRSLLRQGKEEQISGFLKKRLESALWLIKSIEQRRLTLYRVTEQIIKIQESFLEEGIYNLKPLTLKDIAQKLDIHESTVSRATTGKYVQTPRGLYPLKFFFSSGIDGLRGETYSALSIKAHLKELVEKEDRGAPLSDRKIAEQLRKRGIKVSRRTIAKYRQEMNIPASSQRRRLS
ncbi:MAG: RNA polymerase factor sigma-54 [Firmicutes bacterium]|nr:RNA polymerase factor sigma-54 [Bacillota bacterium]